MRLLATIGALVLLLPSAAFAAYNDATLTTDTVITVAGINLLVASPTAVLQSITVSDSSLSVTMPGNSFLRVTSADRRNLTATGYSSVVVTSACTSALSTHTYESPPSAAALTFTINVGGDTCPVGGPAGGSGGGGGGGGGGSYTYTPPVTTTTTAAAKPATTITTTTVTPAAPRVILGVIEKQIARGATDPSVQTLQQILNSDPMTRIAESGVGSPGNESDFFGPGTLKAIQKFQAKYGLAKPGSTGYGVVGPVTRAMLNAVALTASTAPAASVTALASSSTSVPKVSVGTLISVALKKGRTGERVRPLQKVLNSDAETRVSESGVGSPGNETTSFGPATLRAIQKFQEKYGIAMQGDEGCGLVGPKTRAKINEILGKGL